jgi:hypothetical protein
VARAIARIYLAANAGLFTAEWEVSVMSEAILEKAAHIARYAMVALFAVSLSATWQSSGGSGDRVHAATPVSAAPSFLSFTAKVSGNGKFYITDTNRKVICVYSLTNDQLRLVSARKFDHDSRIRDGSIKAPVAMEGMPLTRDEAEVYANNSQKVLDAAAKKYNQPTGGN